MNMEHLLSQLNTLPLYYYTVFDPKKLEFSQRIRHICKQECPMYGKTWACPPAVGEVEECKGKCLSYSHCLLIGTVQEVNDITDIAETLATRPEHEKLSEQVRALLRQQGVDPYILSTEACAICESCTVTEGKPCRFPEKMHPCIESHGINIIPTLEENGLSFQYGENIVTWYSLFFFDV